jgi:uncharacterized protein YndB with AHSA1/START domain
MSNSGKAVVTLPSDREILITREFEAPKHLVYRAYTTPELIERWWSGDRGRVTSVEVDLRVGGTWRFVMMANEGFEVAFHGEYRDIVPDERLVSTEVFEGAPDAQALDTLTLTEHDGRTTMTILVDHGTREQRDAVLATGMQEGLQEALDDLEEVAASLLDRQRAG